MTTFYFYPTIDSTNTAARRLVSTGFSSPTILVSDEQTRGYGQKNRKWVSDPTGGLYFTWLERPGHFEAEQAQKYPILVAQIAAGIIKSITQCEPVVEWPNDLILNDRKLGGILIEMVTPSGQSLPSCAIIGIGININQTDFPAPLRQAAISLAQATGQTWDKMLFIRALAKELRHVFTRHSWSDHR